MRRTRSGGGSAAIAATDASIRSVRSFLATLVVVWIAGAIAGLVYAQQQHIPGWAVGAILPAFLVELSFYVLPGFEKVRDWFRGRNVLLCSSAVLPYLILSAGLHNFSPVSLVELLALAAVIVVWYPYMPRRPWVDFVFLGLVAAVSLGKLFNGIYLNPLGKPSLDILGRLMIARLGITAVLIYRGSREIRFGFWPERKEWSVGARYFLLMVLLEAPVAVGVGFVSGFNPSLGWKSIAVAAGTFAVMLWSVSLYEEFFFRGLLQPSISGWLRSRTGGLLVTAILFGMAHLPFRGEFPNWRFAIVGTVAGLVYGLAFQAGRGVRAPMVTHALTVTAWRVFLN